MTWAPGGTRNRASYPQCVECGTTRNPHKARGLCTSCYLRASVKARGKWRVGVDSCARCGVSKADASYAGRGLCTSCYRQTARRGQLSQWPDRRYGATLAAALVRQVGALEVAELCGVTPATVRRWATGQRVPAHLAEIITAELRRLGA